MASSSIGVAVRPPPRATVGILAAAASKASSRSTLATTRNLSTPGSALSDQPSSSPPRSPGRGERLVRRQGVLRPGAGHRKEQHCLTRGVDVEDVDVRGAREIQVQLQPLLGRDRIVRDQSPARARAHRDELGACRERTWGDEVCQPECPCRDEEGREREDQPETTPPPRRTGPGGRHLWRTVLGGDAGRAGPPGQSRPDSQGRFDLLQRLLHRFRRGKALQPVFRQGAIHAGGEELGQVGTQSRQTDRLGNRLPRLHPAGSGGRMTSQHEEGEEQPPSCRGPIAAKVALPRTARVPCSAACPPCRKDRRRGSTGAGGWRRSP